MARGALTAGMAGAQPVRLAPWLFRPEDSIPVEQTSASAVLVPGLDIATGAPGTATLATLAVSDRAMVRISHMGFGSIDPGDMSLLTWSVRVGGDIYAGYHFIPAPIGTIRHPAEVCIILDPNVTMTIEATNASVGDAHVVTRLVGWMFNPTPGGR